MGVGSWVAAGLAVLVVLYGITIYNRLVSLKHGVDKAWSNIDVLLRQRHDELPKLVEVCQQHRQFEQQTLQQVIEARSLVQTARDRQDIPALGRAEGQLRRGLGQLFAVAEAYPDLKASAAFGQLQTRISQLEDGIADRRELYNESVNLHNVRVESFPDRLLAQRYGFTLKPLLTFEAEQTADVDLKSLFR
jgi:LemA protein